MTRSLAEEFARAVAAKDHKRMREIVAPALDFRAMTPRRFWEADDSEGLIDTLNHWFEESDQIEALEAVECDSFADRCRVGYRLRVRNPDGMHLVEQQAYLTERDGRIDWLRIMCSGFRPVD